MLVELCEIKNERTAMTMPCDKNLNARKVIQISESGLCLYALCDDGTMWRGRPDAERGLVRWIQLEGIPQS
jgi:hypothetical protein